MSTNGYRSKTKLSHVMLLIRQCHVINTPRAVCFVSKLAQASLGVQIEGSECFGVQDRRFPSSSDSESARGPLAERPPPHHESAPPPSPLSPLSLHPIELMVPMIPQDDAACNPPLPGRMTPPSRLAQEGSQRIASVAGQRLPLPREAFRCHAFNTPVSCY